MACTEESIVDAQATAATVATSPPRGGRPAIELDVRLVEETLLLAVERAEPQERRRFRRERDALYEVADPEDREAAFAAFNRRWLERLRLLATLERRVNHLARLREETSGCMVLGATRTRDEHADLRDPLTAGGRRDKPVLFVRLRPETLLDGPRLEALLDRELMHVEDLLDPAFEFVREPPFADQSAALAGLLRERYRTAWDTTVDGRLAASGRLPPGALERRRRDFRAAFAAHGGDGEALFDGLFNGPRPSHRELVELVLATRSGVADGGGVCALCRLPTHRLHPGAAALAPETLAAIRGDFPRWDPADGLCAQCADLYEARASCNASRAQV
jgi:hypothetical protein